MSDQIKVTRTVDAGPEQLFALLADPARHTEIDGAGMLRGVEGGGGSVTGVGDQFFMNMDQEGLGEYRMRNTVTVYEENRAIGWAPELYPLDALKDKIGDIEPKGHTYTWELEPSGSGTRVTQTYDWSKVTDEGFRGLFPRVSEEQLVETIERAGRAAT
ncbi:polyketide cyclase/dehydrase/lipid transport protein [Pseudonocardia sediminis]|uniref:Polyketide cyclase/dehydrase/lipid transport protein n=1 Tax=Pseudonocardia sediminis TaxID=1397368 RepID=A0A4Q7V309_PSEST|nr:SRPBCC family protein [Pseudonocardia sediminis]RZT86969.1 polyketide cyclase/dehydrase/lipid transport protein [Pseudonocardia sediminis]